jgi:CysZ protein
MIQQIKIAFSSYTKALKLIRDYKLWPMIIMSGLVYLVIIILGLWGLYQGMVHLNNYLVNMTWLKNLSSQYQAVKWIAKSILLGISLISFFIYFSVFKYFLLTLASPLYAYISEQTASILTGKKYAFNMAQLLKDIIRGIRLSSRNIIKQMLWSFLILLLSLIPIVGLISVLLFILLDSYYYGFAMLDYNLERQQMSPVASVQFVKQNKGLAIGNGLVFYALFLIPVVGIVIGAPLSAMAAAISLHQSSHKI